MPNPHTRRAFLRAALTLTGVAATAGLAGCDLFSPAPTAPPPGSAQHDLDGFLADTVALRDQYAATITALPELSAALTPVHDDHKAHVDALAAALGLAAPSAGAAAAAGPTRAAAITALAAHEKSARDAAITACVAASGRLAPLLGSIAAARASHLEVIK